MAALLDPVRCLHALLPYMKVSDTENSNGNGDSSDCVVVRLRLTIFCKLARRVPVREMRDVLPVLKQCVYTAVSHNAVDVRKAAIFAVVEVCIVLGKEFISEFDELNPAQLRLVTIYIERHFKPMGEVEVKEMIGKKQAFPDDHCHQTVEEPKKNFLSLQGPGGLFTSALRDARNRFVAQDERNENILQDHPPDVKIVKQGSKGGLFSVWGNY